MRNAIVQKFGGIALADLAQLKKVCEIIAHHRQKGYAICAVVSAMGDTTDRFVEMAKTLCSEPDKRELDALVSCGENMSSALLSICLHTIGIKAKSFSGRQAGIQAGGDHGNGKIASLDRSPLQSCLADDLIAVVAGFQGYNAIGDVITLGRGGSDLTAVAVADMIGASRVDFFKDVNGIYDLDPYCHNNARHFPYLDYEEALNIVKNNHHQVIYAPAIEYAQAHHIKLHVVGLNGYLDENCGTYIYHSKHMVQKAA